MVAFQRYYSYIFTMFPINLILHIHGFFFWNPIAFLNKADLHILFLDVLFSVFIFLFSHCSKETLSVKQSLNTFKTQNNKSAQIAPWGLFWYSPSYFLHEYLERSYRGGHGWNVLILLSSDVPPNHFLQFHLSRWLNQTTLRISESSAY